MFRDDALNVYVDGSSLPGPRRGGIGIRIVTVDGSGNPVTEDCPALGYQSGSNQEMEIMACVEGLKTAMTHDAARTLRRIRIATDSQYVANNWRSALIFWPQQKWRGRHGQPIENADLWRELAKCVKKAAAAGLRVDVEWEPGKTNADNKAVDKLAKASAKEALLKRPLKHVAVRKRISSNPAVHGSVPMRGQELDVRIVTETWLKVQRVYRYKFEVLPSNPEYVGNVDLAFSKHPLKAGHHYRVVVGKEDKNPTIEEVQKELERIRVARNEDIPAMQSIRAAVTENVRSKTFSDADYRKAIRATGRGWVIDLEGGIVGFAVADAKSASIWALIVHPGHERRGYGRQLHAAMVEWLWSQGVEKISLTTEPNTRASRFYESAGWVRTGKNENGESVYEMARLAASR